MKTIEQSLIYRGHHIDIYRDDDLLNPEEWRLSTIVTLPHHRNLVGEAYSQIS